VAVVPFLVVSFAAEINDSVEPPSIVVDDSYVGEGYGIRTPGREKAVALFAHQSSNLTCVETFWRQGLAYALVLITTVNTDEIRK
jgi:hypothetical protein